MIVNISGRFIQFFLVFYVEIVAAFLVPSIMKFKQILFFVADFSL